MPRQLIANCQALDRDFYVVAVTGATDPETVAGSPHDWFDIAAVGAVTERLHHEGCQELCLIGAIQRPDWRHLKPDWAGVKLLPKLLAAAAAGDDAILKVVLGYFEDAGFRVVGAEAVVAELVAPEGPLGRHQADPEDLADIGKGIEVIKALGRFDVGQAAVVRRGQVLAIEAAEGTDAMLARCREFRTERCAGVLVKWPKPSQDERVDLPTIGPTTIPAAAAAGLRGIAIAAGGALLVSREDLVRDADAAGLFVVGMALECGR